MQVTEEVEVVKASGGQTACVVCRSRADITLFQPDPKRPGKHRPVGYCAEHDPNPQAATGGRL